MSAETNGGPIAQPASFAFTAENLAKARAYIAKYPAGRQASAVLPLLDLAQRQSGNWLPRAAMDTVADMLEMARMRVYEVATFYSMFNLRPVGKHFFQICTTTPCWLRGSDEVVEACRKNLGACVNAPVIQINDDFYEDLDGSSTEALIDAFARGETPPPGSALKRQGSAPLTGPKTLHGVPSAGDPNAA
jgi:NADH:ubiquinone oxidoreductase subunit E